MQIIGEFNFGIKTKFIMMRKMKDVKYLVFT